MQISNRATAATAVAGIFYLGLAAAPALASGGSLGGLNAPIGSPGAEVSCAIAVRQVLPTGWRLDLPGSPALCRSISWHTADSALGVYERVGAESGLSVVADVASKTVTIGSRASLALPPSSSPRRRSEGKGPRAFVDTSVRVPLRAIAARYKLKLQCSAVCERELPGPVTLELRGDVGQDARLLEKALGPLEPLRITEDPVTRVLSARLARRASFALELPRPQPWWKRWI